MPAPSSEPTARPPAAVPWLVFGVCFLVLGAAVAPGLSFHDSGEFALAAAVGGLPHPPSAPTWCLAAIAFVRVARLFAPGADTAWLTNLHSAFWGAATAALVGHTAGRWSATLWRSPAATVAAQIAPAGVLLYSAAFVEQATITEQYTLLTALLASALALTTRLSETPSPRTMAALGLTVGLAIGNHLSQLVLLALPAFVLLAAPAPRRALLGAGVAGLLAGLAVFAYLPIRSRANPVLDFGNPETPENFVAAVTRQQWQSRPLADAPPGFAVEWLHSYDFPGQLGVVGLVLALVGGVFLLRHAPLRLLWLLTIGVAYAAGLLLAHLRQDRMDLAYLRGYGVIDWHIPLYTLAALLAGVGLAGGVARLPERSAPLGALLAAVLALVGAATAATRHSLRGWQAPENFVADVLKPLPGDALIIPSGDNLFCMLSYRAFGTPAGLGARWVGWGAASPVALIGRPGWDRAAYLESLSVRADNSLHSPALTAERRAAAPLRVEYAAGNPDAARFLRPDGYLFAVEDAPVSADDAAATERQLHARFPELFRPATGHEHRLEREARGLMHQNRAAYFFERGQWKEAADAFTLACTFLADDGKAWFSLGMARENSGDPKGAADAYAEAIRAEPDLAGPRTNLGVVLAQAGRLPDARALLEEELALHPGHDAARANLALIAKQLAARTP